MNALNRKVKLTDELSIRIQMEEGDEYHLLMDQEEVKVCATVVSYENNKDFLRTFWNPLIIETECDWLAGQILTDLSYEDVIHWTPTELLENVNKDDLDEMDLLVKALETKQAFEKEKDFKGLGISFVAAHEKGKGYGTQLINYYKSNFDYIVLNSLEGALTYWEKQGFVEFYPFYYIWSENPQILEIFKK